jgi:hypothetical protein
MQITSLSSVSDWRLGIMYTYSATPWSQKKLWKSPFLWCVLKKGNRTCSQGGLSEIRWEALYFRDIIHLDWWKNHPHWWCHCSEELGHQKYGSSWVWVILEVVECLCVHKHDILNSNCSTVRKLKKKLCHSLMSLVADKGLWLITHLSLLSLTN